MRLFDSHCHLDDRSYAHDREQVIARAQATGVEAMMVVGITRPSSQKACAMAASTPGVFASVGIHPHDAKALREEDLNVLQHLATSQPGVRAWGEIGLDFNRMYSPREQQETAFMRQLEIAADLNLPLIFHERDSGGRFLELLTENFKAGARGVVHCFSGNQAELHRYLDLGLYIGVTGIITLDVRGRHLRELAPLIPSDRLLVETDAPYLTPAPEKNRTRRNEPAFVKSILACLAEVRGEDAGHLAALIWDNTCRLFGIDGRASTLVG